MTLAEQVAKWGRMPCAGFDVESTGVNPHEDRIVQAAFVRIHPEKRPEIHRWVINPGVEIPQEAIDVHGLTNEYVQAEGADPYVAIYEISGMVTRAMGAGIPVVMFNAPFDLTMLEAENRRHAAGTIRSRLEHPYGPIIDPMVLDKYVDPYRKGICAQDRKNPCQCGAVDKKLTSLCLHYGVRHTGAHDAAADALAACRLWPRIIARHPEKFRGFTLGALHSGQVQWRREQQIGLAQYFNRQGQHAEAATVETEWPVLPTPERTLL